MYNRQEYSHNFALSDRCFSTCLLCYSSWRKFFSQTSMLHTYLLQSSRCFFNDLHICSKRHYHDINFPGRAVAFLLNEDLGATGDYLPKKTNIRYPHSGITGDAHSSYKVNPNCALCQKTSFFFLSQFHVKSRDSSSNIFFLISLSTF